MPKRSTRKRTKRIVERLKADGKDTIFWDSALTGFGVRVHTTGRKLYIVQSRTLRPRASISTARCSSASVRPFKCLRISERNGASRPAICGAEYGISPSADFSRPSRVPLR